MATAWTSSIAEALAKPSGARFFKCALQVNPYAYLLSNNKATEFADESSYNRAMVEACLANGIEVIGITDHYRATTARTLARAARGAGITVFPGFEAVTKDGVHALCLFDPDTPEEDLERYIGACGVHSEQQTSPIGKLDLEELLRESKEWGAVIIAAHVASDRGGLLSPPRGQPTVRAWRSSDLLAVALSKPRERLTENIRRIIENKDPEYQRDRPIAVINAADVDTPRRFSDPCAWSWIKMSSLTVEGLRQAFLDPDSRVRLPSDPAPEEHTELVAIAWEGGFLDGASIHFNENLNVLIGGRGTGKSTVIESLRYALDLEPLGVDAEKGHEGIVRYVLQSGTKVSLLVRSHRPARKEFLIERTVPNPPVVRGDDGAVLPLTPADVAPQSEVFGQHEISEVSRSRERLTRLLERFVKADVSAAGRKQVLRRELERSRQRILDVRSELVAINERLASLPGFEETLKRYREAGLEDRLRDQSMMVREERLLDSAQGRLAPLREAVERLQGQLPIDTAPLSPSALADMPDSDVLAAGAVVLDELSAKLAELAVQMDALVDKAEQEFENVRRAWQERRDRVLAAYQEILRDLQRSRIDGEEFIRLRRQIEELRPLQDRAALLDRTLKGFEEARSSLLVEWEDLKQKEFGELRRAAREVNAGLEGRVRVQVKFAGNRGPLLDLIRERILGRTAEAINVLRSLPDLSLVEFVRALRAGGTALEQTFGIPHAQADRLSQAPSEVLMQIEEVDLPPTTQISLNVADAGRPPEWRDLDELSTGQKATAVLLLLLLESRGPLIVDQPEDDLDNRFIADGVVPEMREGKRRRQFVFSTHNANIPVLGDAELIVGLAARGEAGGGRADIPEGNLGSIDSLAARELAEEILEGGKVAFELRRLKYGF